jgi:hypothetical protein
VVVGIGYCRDSRIHPRRVEERENSPRHGNRGRSNAQSGIHPPHSLNRGCQFPKCCFFNENTLQAMETLIYRTKEDLHQRPGIRFDNRLVRVLLMDDADRERERERERDLECWGSSRLRSFSRSASFFSFLFLY